MSKAPKDLSDEEKVLLARVNRPLPLRVRREMAVCADMDQFAAALEETNAVLTSIVSRPAAMSPYASPAAVQTNWKDSIQELQVSLGNTNRFAHALIQSIRIMLVLE